jgi:hypothetical protein
LQLYVNNSLNQIKSFIYQRKTVIILYHMLEFTSCPCFHALLPFNNKKRPTATDCGSKFYILKGVDHSSGTTLTSPIFKKSFYSLSHKNLFPPIKASIRQKGEIHNKSLFISSKYSNHLAGMHYISLNKIRVIILFTD